MQEAQKSAGRKKHKNPLDARSIKPRWMQEAQKPAGCKKYLLKPAGCKKQNKPLDARSK